MHPIRNSDRLTLQSRRRIATIRGLSIDFRENCFKSIVSERMIPPAPLVTPVSPSLAQRFTPDEVLQFQRDGYLIVRGMVEPDVCRRMLEITHEGLAGPIEPVEYEADLRYPGAPESRAVQGGHTIRRLKEAQSRHPLFTDWVRRTDHVGRLQQLLGQRVVMPLAHHNCIMTKQPNFSSETHWHQDIRYWSYSRPELVSDWLALGTESVDNGCLHLIPGTHVMNFARHRFDEALFLRPELPENAELIASQVPAELEPGDVLFFHCRTFHAAGRNKTHQPKFSVVFTYRPEDNPPVLGSRSASMPEILMPPVL